MLSKLTLHDLLLEPSRRQNVIHQSVLLVEQEVANKAGFSGMAIKAVFMVVKKIRPGFVAEIVDHLLDAFVAQLEPFYGDFQATQAAPNKSAPYASMQAYLQAHRQDVANKLLSVTDARLDKIKNRTLKSGYERLRPTAAKHVEAAVPAVGKLTDQLIAAAKAPLDTDLPRA